MHYSKTTTQHAMCSLQQIHTPCLMLLTFVPSWSRSRCGLTFDLFGCFLLLAFAFPTASSSLFGFITFTLTTSSQILTWTELIEKIVTFKGKITNLQWNCAHRLYAILLVHSPVRSLYCCLRSRRVFTSLSMSSCSTTIQTYHQNTLSYNH